VVSKKQLQARIETLEKEKTLLWNTVISLNKRVVKLEKEVFNKEDNKTDIINESLKDDRIDNAQEFLHKGAK
jgi:uncharacterized coiled-coil protein SlyX